MSNQQQQQQQQHHHHHHHQDHQDHQVTDLQLEEAARQGHVELLAQVALQRLLDFRHSRAWWRTGGRALFREAMRHARGGVVQCLVRRSVASGEDFVYGCTLGHAAAFAGDLAALDQLGDDELHARDRSGLSLLHAAAWGGHVEAVERLVELGADPNETNEDGETCLHYAALGGHVAAMERLVQLGADADVTSRLGETCLHKAAGRGHVAVLERLVEHGGDPDRADKVGETCLHHAALEGHVAVIERLVELGADPNVGNGFGETCLHKAASRGHVEAVERLVELDADPSVTNDDGKTCLHFAAGGGYVVLIERLVELGADPHAIGTDGKTCLHYAAEGGHVAAIDKLVGLGVDPKATNNYGRTTIHTAAWGGHVAAIERLVELGADPGATNKNGDTCLHVAAAGGHVEAIERLVELEVDPNAMNERGKTCLHCAVRGNHVAAIARLVELGADPSLAQDVLVELLTRKAAAGDVEAIGQLVGLGVDPNAANKKGETCLHVAARADHVGVVERLVELGADASLAQDSLVELLSRKAAAGDVVAVERLVELGADLNARDMNGETCLHIAAKGGDVALIERLVELGADLNAANEDGETCLQTVASGGDLAMIEHLVELGAGTAALSSLDLSSSTFDNLDWLRSCFSLTSLSLASCSIFSADLDVIAALPRLERLVLAGSTVAALDSLTAGCRELRFLDVSGCGISHAPVFLASLPALEQVNVADNPFVDGLQEYAELLADPVAALDFLRTLALSSGGKTCDVPVVLVGHGRAGKSQVLHALLHESSWVGKLPGVVERAPLVTERTIKVECGVHALQMSAQRRSSGEMVTDEFEARFFDTPGQMEFFASSMTVVAPLFSSCVVVCVVRCVPHGVSLAKDKLRIASEFRLWLAEVSRHQADPRGRASVALVLTHRDVLQQARGKEAVSDVESWLGDLAEELRVEFEDSLDVHGSASFVNATVAGVSGDGVAPVREQLESLAHSRFVLGPTLPDVLVDARALVVSEEVRRHRIFGRPALEKLLSSKFAERGLTLRLVCRLLEVLETNGSVLCSPAGRLVVVDPGWISGVMSSLYVDPQLHDLEHELLTHLRQFVDGDDALLERLLLVLVSNGIAVPLRVSRSATGACKTESYLIVGRWMTDGDGANTSGVGWTTAAWFELVTGKAWSAEQAARMLVRLDEEPALRLVSLRCTSGVRTGPSFLTWLMYELSKKLHARQHSFTVRRSGFACVLPFTRFHAAVHVQLPASGREFDLTVLAKAEDAAAALSFVLLEVVLPTLDKLSPGGGAERIDVVQRCGGCVGTHERLESDPLHDRELAGGVQVGSVQALCKEVCDGANYRAEKCVLTSVEPEEVDDRVPLDFVSSFVRVIDSDSIELDQESPVLMGEYDGTEVVLKELKVSSDEALVAFEEEAELLARASRHPCISLLLGICRMNESQVYLVMERAGVCDLEQALCKTPKKPLLGAAWSEFGVLLGLLKDVASALRHMHSLDPPIVHNDVALRNVLVRHEDGRNRAKLTDMGLARGVKRGTVKRLAKGTPMPKWQMAPESVRSREVSPASDVFQFGMLVFEMMARQRPFWREWMTPGGKERKAARVAVVEGIENGARPSWKLVKQVGAFCPRWLRELVDKCCSQEAKDRPTMVWVSDQLAKRIKEMHGVPRKQDPLGVDEPASEVGVQEAGYVEGGGEGGPCSAQHSTLKEEQESVDTWTVDDACAWLVQLADPACAELVPLFRHQGVDGTVLLDLEAEDLTELGVPRLAVEVLLRARDELLPPPE